MARLTAASRLAGLAAALLLAACGFHLRGQGPLPPALAKVYIDYHAGYTVLEPTLQKVLVERLRARGAEVVDEPDEDASVLNIYGVRQSQRTVSIGAQGQTLEYKLTVSTSFDLMRGAEARVPRSSLSSSQSYTYTVTRLLSEEEERDRLTEALQADLADRILLQIDTVLSRQPPTGARAGST